MATDYFDVIIVGAGLSGIGAAKILQDNCPSKSYTILEGRENMGGTWDLFRYPGVRSDSDMHTLGYRFKPWVDKKAIAEGPAIRRYINETADENNITPHIRYRQLVKSAEWSSQDATWAITVEDKSSGESRPLRCNFLLMCSGYYSYRQGHAPEFSGSENFSGEIIHPQQWPEALNYTGKKVVVIGSGATAVTLVPAMAEAAASVTMLQRSPTYMASRPWKDRIANILRAVLPDTWAYAITRWKNITSQQFFYRRSRTRPESVRKMFRKHIRKHMGPNYDVDKHFTPSYDPWDQRVCLVPGSDFFTAVRDGNADIVTDHIDHFTRTGIELKSGQHLDADIIVTATGIELVVMGEMAFSVDGKPIDFSKTWSYKGLMVTDVPNLVSTFGYINASWTLRADITAEWVCRVLNHMDATSTKTAVPIIDRETAEAMPKRPWIDDFSANYMQRAMPFFPKQGDRAPWINPQDYAKDKKMFRQSDLDGSALQLK